MSEYQVENQRPIIKSYVDSVEIVKLQKFVVALYDRIEQLELENDSIRNELSSFSARLSALPNNSTLADTSFLKVKTKRARPKKVEIDAPSKNALYNSLKASASSLLPEVADSIDLNAALEFVSWSVLNGSNPEHSITFLSENIAL